MTEQMLARYACALVLVAGVVILCITLADRLWLVGVVLIVVGAGVGAPLWVRHFNEQAEVREVQRLRPEAARKNPSQPEV